MVPSTATSTKAEQCFYKQQQQQKQLAATSSNNRSSVMPLGSSKNKSRAA